MDDGGFEQAPLLLRMNFFWPLRIEQRFCGLSRTGSFFQRSKAFAGRFFELRYRFQLCEPPLLAEHVGRNTQRAQTLRP